MGYFGNFGSNRGVFVLKEEIFGVMITLYTEAIRIYFPLVPQNDVLRFINIRSTVASFDVTAKHRFCRARNSG